jgi:aryl-alcohol dehydrogenase-like predicted oxidoreductase
VAVIETSVSIADQNNLDTVVAPAQKSNIGIIAKRPIANACWKDASQQPGFYGNYASEYHRRLKEMKLNPAELGFSGPHELCWPEIALRFTLSFPGVHTAIIGTTNPDNARANIAYAEKGPLPAAVVEKIRAACRHCDPRRQWSGQQ